MSTAYIILIMLNVLIRPPEYPVKIDPDLTLQAQVRAEQLCDDKQWSHDGYTDYFQGTGTLVAGENLAKQWHSTYKAINAWILSPSHYKNMIDTRFKVVGVGEDTRCDLIVLFFADNYEKTATTTTNKVLGAQGSGEDH